MAHALLLLVCSLGLAGAAGPLRRLFPAPYPEKSSNDTGDPLFLTPLLESGDIATARQLSQVGALPNSPSIPSYSGYLTVNKKLDSNLFFWFFPSLNKDPNAPVLLWLQGGPGGTSLFGLFLEHGPLQLNADLSASLRKYTWAHQFSVLYIDNPVGTGFSFTRDPAGFAKNQTDVARDLYSALQQFFTMFPEYANNDFYVTGESYAGKYVPAIAYKIHSEGSSAKMKLKGIAIGDGLCDPVTMVDYGDYLYQLGLLDRRQRDHMNRGAEEAVRYIRDQQWLKAFRVFDSLLNGDRTQGPSYFKNATGLNFYYNYLMTQPPKEFALYPRFLAQPPVRRALHVGNLTFNDGGAVEDNLLEDIMKSVKPWVATLMDNYRVLFYNGQLDIIVGYPLTVNFLHSVQWKHADEYKRANRTIWKVMPADEEVAGYVHHVGDFYEVLVRNAGHIMPYDQPRAAYDLITRFVRGKSFN